MTYLFWGKVIRGKNRGKSLGFPTINLRLSQSIPEGIYVSRTKFEGRIFKSVSFIGAARTFGETEILAESYIFDFSSDIYGKWVSVKLLKKIRDNQKFASEKELIERVELDKCEALEYFREIGQREK
jgi:riboflavin kinase/FMN adenylyltransferase